MACEQGVPVGVGVDVGVRVEGAGALVNDPIVLGVGVTRTVFVGEAAVVIAAVDARVEVRNAYKEDVSNAYESPEKPPRHTQRNI